MILTRRAVLSAPLAALPSAIAAAVPGSGRLAFEIFRNDSRIGTHELRFARNGEAVDVRIDVEIRVGLGPITFFRYRHGGIERWVGDRFVRLETETDNNGEALRVLAERTGGAVRVVLPDDSVVSLPEESLPLTHWNRRQMRSPLFNPQDGKVMRLDVTPRGQARVRLADGRTIDAAHYALKGEATMDDWYDADDVWAALRAQAEDGSIIDYRRLP